ncbi:hypothetical protein DVH03_15430 [Lactiplantibacillus plantarum]|nr:hypothetical protein DVH03_15430 [Lactiplantibacillus plantarum]
MVPDKRTKVSQFSEIDVPAEDCFAKNSRIKGGNTSHRPSVITTVGRFFIIYFWGGFAYAKKGNYFWVIGRLQI